MCPLVFLAHPGDWLTAPARFAVWPKVREFVDSLARGSVVADVGCGNGKYLGLRPRDLAVIGSDFSAGVWAREGGGNGWGPRVPA